MSIIETPKVGYLFRQGVYNKDTGVNVDIWTDPKEGGICINDLALLVGQIESLVVGTLTIDQAESLVAEKPEVEEPPAAKTAAKPKPATGVRAPRRRRKYAEAPKGVSDEDLVAAASQVANEYNDPNIVLEFIQDVYTVSKVSDIPEDSRQGFLDSMKKLMEAASE